MQCGKLPLQRDDNKGAVKNGTLRTSGTECECIC